MAASKGVVTPSGKLMCSVLLAGAGRKPVVLEKVARFRSIVMRSGFLGPVQMRCERGLSADRGHRDRKRGAAGMYPEGEGVSRFAPRAINEGLASSPLGCIGWTPTYV